MCIEKLMDNQLNLVHDTKKQKKIRKRTKNKLICLGDI